MPTDATDSKLTRVSVVAVIDDEKSMSRVMHWVLKDLGFEVRGYETAEAAMDELVALRPALVICDVRLPGMEGTGLTRWLKAHPDLCRTPVILMSAYREPQNHQADAFVSKPCEIEDLENTITRLLAVEAGASPEGASL